MNVTPSYRNSPFTLKAMPSSKSVGVDFGAVMKARQETAEAMTPKMPPQGTVDQGVRSDRPIRLNYGLAGGSNYLGYSYNAKYAEGSTEENPIVTVEWVDPDDNEYTEDIVLNDINPRNASFIEMAALNAHLRVNIPGLQKVARDNAMIPYDKKMNQIAGFEKEISTFQRCGYVRDAQESATQMNVYLDFFAKAKEAKAVKASVA